MALNLTTTKDKIALGSMIGLPLIGASFPWFLTKEPKSDKIVMSVIFGVIGLVVGFGIAGIIGMTEPDNTPQ